MTRKQIEDLQASLTIASYKLLDEVKAVNRRLNDLKYQVPHEDAYWQDVGEEAAAQDEFEA